MHLLKDAQLIRNLALPAAGATAQTAVIDLLQGPYQEPHFEVEMDLPALPSLADGKSVTVTLQDSPDGVTFTPIAALAPLVVTGAGGVGAQAVMRKVRVEWDTQRYLRANVAMDAGAGDNTAAQFTMALVF